MNKIDENNSSCRVTVTVTKNIDEQLKSLAAKKRVSSAWVIREAIRVYLKNEEPLFNLFTEIK